MNSRVVILRNHGTADLGRDDRRGVHVALAAAGACDIQIAAAGAGPMIRLPAEVLSKTRLEVAAQQPRVCEAVFGSLVRQVEAADPSYCT